MKEIYRIIRNIPTAEVIEDGVIEIEPEQEVVEPDIEPEEPEIYEPEPPVVGNLNKLSKPVLYDMCRERGLKVSGTKKDLIARLQQK